MIWICTFEIGSQYICRVLCDGCIGGFLYSQAAKLFWQRPAPKTYQCSSCRERIEI
jgi:hypothetical protein